MQHTPSIFKGVPRRRAFTLVELLVAIGIIILLLAVAVPVFNVLTGSRSAEQGINIVSANLARIRNEAIGQQRYRGVMFYLDPNTSRVAMATIAETDLIPATSFLPADTWFDIDPNAEPVLLPPGVGVQTLIGGTFDTASPPKRTSNGYIGMNDNVLGMITFRIRVGGMIVFAPDGSLYVGVPGMYWGTSAAPSNFGQTLFGGTPPAAFQGSGCFAANLGLCVFDSNAYTSQFGGDSAWTDQFNNPPTVAFYNANEKPKEDWLDANATPLVVNRYNGTLIKGE